MQIFHKLVAVFTLALFLVVSAPGPARADDAGTESGDELAVVVDLFVLRPIGLVTTTAGIAVFVVSLPISLATLSVSKAFNALVVGPARYTFVRALGNETIAP